MSEEDEVIVFQTRRQVNGGCLCCTVTHLSLANDSTVYCLYLSGQIAAPCHFDECCLLLHYCTEL